MMVNDYHYRYNLGKDEMTVLIFDKAYQKLYIQQYENFKTIKVLKRSFELSELNSQIKMIKCKNSKDESIFCLLVGNTHLFNMVIKKTLNTKISRFSWDFKVISKFENVFYEQTL